MITKSKYILSSTVEKVKRHMMHTVVGSKLIYHFSFILGSNIQYCENISSIKSMSNDLTSQRKSFCIAS